MNINSVESAHLSTSCGKLLCIQGRQRPNHSHQLVAKNEQKLNPGNSVKVYHILYNRTRQCMAFGFEVENKSVFPVVTHGEAVKFKALPTDKLITGKAFDETFLFQWGEQEISGDWRSLESVAKPKKYLCVKNEVKVTITKKQSPVFRICYSDEKKGEELQSLCGSGKIQETNPYKKISWQRRNLKRGPSCREGSASNKPLHCNDRKTKRMKM
ncbi:uncharacterized protein LOC107737075 isoform X1 [Sinocyclocheilus rhinocerous]|uniref:uncharacterized protein LOC107737075 isoform X1 n=1 Tax=Sinocyclocheilus rhinocerous TaxID=307959 RepID=UPI0007B818B7|nr:PREDICTED: uncharacterized protein LOC107737075 isoform X1 [Sinocyclocheilus rhinocerous]